MITQPHVDQTHDNWQRRQSRARDVLLNTMHASTSQIPRQHNSHFHPEHQCCTGTAQNSAENRAATWRTQQTQYSSCMCMIQDSGTLDRNQNRIVTRIWLVGPWAILQPSVRCHQDRFTTFWVIPLTDRQTDRQMLSHNSAFFGGRNNIRRKLFSMTPTGC